MEPFPIKGHFWFKNKKYILQNKKGENYLLNDLTPDTTLIMKVISSTIISRRSTILLIVWTRLLSRLILRPTNRPTTVNTTTK